MISPLFALGIEDCALLLDLQVKLSNYECLIKDILGAKEKTNDYF